MHNTNENQGAKTTNDNNYTDNKDNANWTVLTEASSEFEAEVIAEAIRARGVNAIAVSLPPPMLPTNASHITGQAVVMADKKDMHEAALALEDVKQSRIEDEEQHQQHATEHNSPNSNHQDEPYQISSQADYERRKQRRAGRAARYAIRLIAIFTILIIAAFNPPLAAILLIALLVIEVFLLISAIQQANNANDITSNH